ncbi:hypothetical protein C5S32_09210 [ANME-1 cluster archaeon GoMg1]|nr:hypothetical protein [ANME-1 cluster archaeon GoMg1]
MKIEGIIWLRDVEDKLAIIYKKRETSSEALINAWLKEKIREQA